MDMTQDYSAHRQTIAIMFIIIGNFLGRLFKVWMGFHSNIPIFFPLQIDFALLYNWWCYLDNYWRTFILLQWRGNVVGLPLLDWWGLKQLASSKAPSSGVGLSNGLISSGYKFSMHWALPRRPITAGTASQTQRLQPSCSCCCLALNTSWHFTPRNCSIFNKIPNLPLLFSKELYCTLIKHHHAYMNHLLTILL